MSTHRRTRRGSRRPVTPVVLALAGVACILPDRFIDFTDPDVNEHPVRFLESIPMSLDDRCECDFRATGIDSCAEPGEEQPNCPYAPVNALPVFMNPADAAFKFCSCSMNERDTRAPGAIDDLFVIDQDAIDNETKDSIFAVALLDLPNDLEADPADFVAYREIVDPGVPLSEVKHDLLFNPDLLPVPRPRMRQLRLANPDNRFDLCNDAGAGFGPLTPGAHTLTLMVTDREWLTIENVDMETNEVLDRFVREGVPDVASGATWDIKTFVFSCLDPGDDDCACEPEL